LDKEIVYHGGGYVGLTGAIHYAQAGFKVFIYDIDQKMVDDINAGKPRAGEYLGYIDADVQELVRTGRIEASTNFDELALKPVHFLAVPTEKNGEPFMGIVKESVSKLMLNMPKHGLIIIESTITPGTVKQIILDEAQKYTYRKFGDEVFLVVSPRTDWFADKEKNLTNLPKIIGGVTPRCTEEAINIISAVCPIENIKPTSAGVAELVKSGQNALYFAQIVAAHELALAYPDVDMNEVLRLISTHWRLPDLFLGPGVSGRCVPSGAKYIVDGAKTKSTTYLFEQLLEMEENWREHIADVITRQFEPTKYNANILVLGVAYRPNFTDTGYSAGLSIAKYLRDCAWDAFVHDSCVPFSQLEKIVGDIPIAYPGPFYDAVFLATAHDAYLKLPELEYQWKQNQVIVDATGAWEKYRGVFEDRHSKYIRIGEEGWNKF
jgi:UDP-N-acetyl-D-glucosamine dehydrogenase